MTKKILALLWLSMLVPLPAFAFYLPFNAEPFVDLLGGKVAGQNGFRLHIQHHFQNWDIAATNIRLGYGVIDHLDIYAGMLYHANDIIYGPEAAALVHFNEYEVMPVFGFMNETKDQPLDLAVSAGVNRQTVHFEFINHTLDSTQTCVSGQVLMAKTIADVVYVSAAPVAVYNATDSKNTVGVMTGYKLMWSDKIALVGEYSLLVSNPYQWKNPWSLGVQFHAGPHMWTLFYANTYGFTIPNLLQGLDQTFFGFRYAF